jgi:hypothetical protein
MSQSFLRTYRPATATNASGASRPIVIEFYVVDPLVATQFGSLWVNRRSSDRTSLVSTGARFTRRR